MSASPTKLWCPKLNRFATVPGECSCYWMMADECWHKELSNNPTSPAPQQPPTEEGKP